MILQRKSDIKLTLGAEPRADLLPPEVVEAAKGRTLRRRMTMIVVLVVVVTVAGYAAATLRSVQSQQALDAENNTTMMLLAEQAKYVEVREVTSMLTLAEAARQMGTSTEIDWKAYLAQVEGSLPSGTRITAFTADSASPLASFQPPTVPLQAERVASLTFSAAADSLPDVKQWLNALMKLEGYADAWPSTVALVDGVYNVNITMHINQDALANRFTQEAKGQS